MLVVGLIVVMVVVIMIRVKLSLYFKGVRFLICSILSIAEITLGRMACKNDHILGSGI